MASREQIEKAIEELPFILSGEYEKDCLCIHCQEMPKNINVVLEVLTQALEPRCEYQRGTHCNLPNGAMREVNRKMMIAVAEENKRYREALEIIETQLTDLNKSVMFSKDITSTLRKLENIAKTAFEGKAKECPYCHEWMGYCKGECQMKPKEMPDRVGEIINKWAKDYGYFLADGEFNELKSELLKVVLECVPKKRVENDYEYWDAFNACRSQVIEAMERLFGKEIA